MFKGLWRHYIALLCPLNIKRNLYHCSIQLWLLFIHFHNSWSIHCFSICTCRVHWIWFEHIFIWNKSTYTSEFIPEILFQTNFTRIKLKWFFFFAPFEYWFLYKNNLLKLSSTYPFSYHFSLVYRLQNFRSPEKKSELQNVVIIRVCAYGFI